MILRPPFAARPGRIEAHLRLIATTDLHMYLRPWDYVADRPRQGTGLLAAAPLIRALREEVPSALLLDVGDLLQGNALADYLAQASGPHSGLHPLIAAMNLMDYSGGTLGNHDFDYGMDYLERTLAEAQFPIVCTNLQRPDGADYRPPSALIPVKVTDAQGTSWPLTVGIIGLIPPQTVTWARQQIAGRLVAQDIVSAALDHVPRLRAAGAEIIVALCHSGMGEVGDSPGTENAAISLAAVDGVDVVLMGHTHEIFPGTAPWSDRVAQAIGANAPAVDPVAGRLQGKPAVQAGCQGSHVGVVDLLIARGPDGWRPVADAVAALPVRPASMIQRRTAADAALIRATATAHRATLADTRRIVGMTELPINSYFTLVAPDAGLQLLADAQRAAALPALAATAWAGLPLISAVAPNRVGGPGGPDNYLNVGAGPLARRHLAALAPYPNTLSLLVLTGEDVADWLERAVSGYARITPGHQDQPLLDPAFPGYVFDLLDGLSYLVDLAAPARTDVAGRIVAPAARRIRSIGLDGRALAPQDRLVVVTNAYRAGGGGGFAAATQGKIIAEVPLTGQEAMLRLLAAGSRVTLRPTWAFAPMQGTSAWFDSAPAAARHLPLPGRHVADAGAAPGGFRRFRLDLGSLADPVR